MIFQEVKLKGAYIIEPERLGDERGFFARTFCQKEFEKQGVNFLIVQSSTSFNKKRAILRGMHYQAAPYEEIKLVSCVRGAIYDVIIDLRPNSSTYLQWFAAELSCLNHKMLYIPKGFAHGFQTLTDDTVVLYHMSEFYHPESAQGIRWDDPIFGIKWPLAVTMISIKDQNYNDFSLNRQ